MINGEDSIEARPIENGPFADIPSREPIGYPGYWYD